MAVRFYMDQNISQAITVGLRLRRVDVLTAREDGCDRWPDDRLLDRAEELNRVLFTHDDDFLAIAAIRQERNIPFPGLVFAPQLHVTIGHCIRDLEIIAKASTPDDLMNQIFFLPI